MTRSEIENLLRQRLAAVEERLQAACRRSQRARREITLVGITKTISPSVVALLPPLGLVHLGENRPQELWRKAAAVPSSVHWHLVGHLQRNKIERTLPLVRWIHSVDSLRLLEALEKEAAKAESPVAVLLEVNASREPNKYGFAPEELPGLVPAIRTLRHVHVRGLMTMAALEADPERCRETFAAVRSLRDRLAKEVAAPHRLEQLSMGMSNDFEVAVEEGATLVRIGTALFEGLEREEA
ncbi:MAG TPA: YggS family pyridoxal phosphate-dependent enzyme [Gemmataceae bacterium]|nr:YggS family pyridoxal phosphate-dependent enzyme [Gemmataceae bacterium]